MAQEAARSHKVPYECSAILERTIEQTTGTMPLALKTVATATLEDQNCELTRAAKFIDPHGTPTGGTRSIHDGGRGGGGVRRIFLG